MRFSLKAFVVRVLAAAAAVAASASAGAEDASDFKEWVRTKCLKANVVGEALYEKTDGSSEPYAKFDWQQAACHFKVDSSGNQQTGVVDYYFALRRSEFVKTASSARRAPIAVPLSVHAYRLYYRRLNGQWGVVAYRPVANSLTTALSQHLNPSEGQLFKNSDFAVRKGMGEVAVAAMAPMLGIEANTNCAAAGVICSPSRTSAGG